MDEQLAAIGHPLRRSLHRRFADAEFIHHRRLDLPRRVRLAVLEEVGDRVLAVLAAVVASTGAERVTGRLIGVAEIRQPRGLNPLSVDCDAVGLELVQLRRLQRASVARQVAE